MYIFSLLEFQPPPPPPNSRPKTLQFKLMLCILGRKSAPFVFPHFFPFNSSSSCATALAYRQRLKQYFTKMRKNFYSWVCWRASYSQARVGLCLGSTLVSNYPAIQLFMQLHDNDDALARASKLTANYLQHRPCNRSILTTLYSLRKIEQLSSFFGLCLS